MIVSDLNKNLYLSSRNLKGAKVVTASEINTYDIVNAKSVLVTEGSLEKIESLLS
jgi:large subunit ribosomal protein L4